MKQSISVIVPTYNEAQTIGQLLPAVEDALTDVVSEIVIVDDDSPDGTAQRAREHTVNCRVIVREDESGLSSAVLRGFDAAMGDVYAVIDADLQHPPRRLRNLALRVAGGADMAIGSRFGDGGGIDGDWPAHRKLISYGATALAWAAVPQARATADPMSGLFAIDAELVEAARERLRPRGYKIGLELLARCPVERVDEVPYTFRERAAGESNLGVAEYARYLQHLARLTVPARRGTGLESVREVSVDES